LYAHMNNKRKMKKKKSTGWKFFGHNKVEKLFGAFIKWILHLEKNGKVWMP
jgi:hypothetical protein